MRSTAWLLMTLSALCFGAACGDDSEDGDADAGTDDHEHPDAGDLPEVDCGAQEIPTFGEVAAFDKCTMCHSSELSGTDRAGAPAGFDWDVYDTAVEHAEHMVEEVSEGNMPPPESGITLTAAEEEDLYLWALCDTPE